MSSEIHGAIAERYSSALFELAEQQAVLDEVAADLRVLRQMAATSDDFRRLLRSPVLSRSDQQKAVQAIAARAGFQALTVNFLGLLAKNRRLFALDAVALAYLDRLAGKHGEVLAEVQSAVALSPDQVGEIVAILKKYMGSNVSLDAKVDPGLLGGLVVRVGSRMVDNSLKTKLQQLKLAMKGIG